MLALRVVCLRPACACVHAWLPADGTLAELLERITEQWTSAIDVIDQSSAFDSDGSGTLEFDEFCALCEKMELGDLAETIFYAVSQ